MLEQLRPAVMLLCALTIVTGVIYPTMVTAISQLAFPHQANGSMMESDDGIVGSELIGQPFSQPEYFWGRLSATQPVPYNAAASSGSNHGPWHPELKEAAAERIDSLRIQGTEMSEIPIDLVTSSASGLDPHISPAAADFQVSRIARTRRMSEKTVRELVHQHTQGRQFGVLGEPRVNVLQLNLALDHQTTK